jgi:hypothetical protein
MWYGSSGGNREGNNMVSRAAPICMLFLRSHLRSITCGTVFRRIEEVTEDVRDDTRPETYSDDVLQPERSFSGPPRPSQKRKREDDDLLTNMRKFRRIQLITAADMPTKVEVDNHSYIGQTALPRAAQNGRGLRRDKVNYMWTCCACRASSNSSYFTHCTEYHCNHQWCHYCPMQSVRVG